MTTLVTHSNVAAMVLDSDRLSSTTEPEEEDEEEMGTVEDPEEVNERAKIRGEMDDFMACFKGLSEQYQLVEKIGEGTFSSVYKAIDLKHDQYDNGYWNLDIEKTHESPEPPTKRRKGEERSRTLGHTTFVAIKRIYVTSSPNRILNELSLLTTLRENALNSCVVPIIAAMRFEDQVIAILPYVEHIDFREYYKAMTLKDIKCYFRALFRALKHVHSEDIIHRDIKPSNFLYDMTRKTGVLVDFGLAQYAWDDEIVSSSAKCKHVMNTSLMSASALSNKENQSSDVSRSITKSVPKSDKRPQIRANRAGTRGFRAPEVLFKCTSQSTALDIWSAGVILLSILTHRFPFFNSNDDIEALVELACIFGRKETRRCAALHNRTFEATIPSIKNDRIPFSQLVLKARPAIYSGTDLGYIGVMYDETRLALDLLEACMTMDVTKRITAKEALQHEFLAT